MKTKLDKIIGIDFDNTVICHDRGFYQTALDRSLIPADIPVVKNAIRDYLLERSQKETWMEIQGYVYGVRIGDAPSFPGVKPFLVRCGNEKVKTYIVSHKTPYPFKGPKYDLRQAAWAWLEKNSFFDGEKLNLTREQVYFESTRQAKIARISALGCHYFIDDFPEFLSDPTFPTNVTRILFDPAKRFGYQYDFDRVTSWSEVEELIFGNCLSHVADTTLPQRISNKNER